MYPPPTHTLHIKHPYTLWTYHTYTCTYRWRTELHQAILDSTPLTWSHLTQRPGKKFRYTTHTHYLIWCTSLLSYYTALNVIAAYLFAFFQSYRIARLLFLLHFLPLFVSLISKSIYKFLFDSHLLTSILSTDSFVSWRTVALPCLQLLACSTLKPSPVRTSRLPWIIQTPHLNFQVILWPAAPVFLLYSSSSS